jgi:hypothetical protein
MGLTVRALRILGAASLVSGVVVATGAAPALSQTSVTFNYLNDAENLGPNSTSISTPDPANRREGTITYNGTGAIPTSSTPPPSGWAFDNITGIEFLNPLNTFSYSGQADTTTASIFTFSPFYFLGTCLICKEQPGEEAITVPDFEGNILTNTISVPDQGVIGTNVTISSGPVPIRFGSNGSPGVISFSASNFVAINNTIGSGTGFISFDMIPDTTGVPGPIPILGASTAFAFSRRLRRRVAIARVVD